MWRPQLRGTFTSVIPVNLEVKEYRNFFIKFSSSGTKSSWFLYNNHIYSQVPHIYFWYMKTGVVFTRRVTFSWVEHLNILLGERTGRSVWILSGKRFKIVFREGNGYPLSKQSYITLGYSKVSLLVRSFKVFWKFKKLLQFPSLIEVHNFNKRYGRNI